jgi:NTE family protein
MPKKAETNDANPDKKAEITAATLISYIGGGLFTLFCLIAVWAFICTGWQMDWWTATTFVIQVAIACSLIVAAIKDYTKPIGRWVAAGALLAFMWVTWIGSYNYKRDLIFLAVSFFGTMAASRRGREWLRALPMLITTVSSSLFKTVHDRSVTAGVDNFKPAINKAKPLQGAYGFIFFVIFLLVFWVGISVFDALDARSPLKPHPERFAAIREKSSWKDVRVGVALSGGGYRAVLMHAGVLDAFEKLGVPVTHMASVSGGSITSAFYAAGGDPKELRDAIKQGRFNLTRDLSDAHNAIRVPFPFKIPWTNVRLFPWYSFTRSDVQASLLDRVLFGKMKMSELKRAPESPRLMVCTTDLYSGSFLGFSQEGVLRRVMVQPREKNDFVNVEATPDDDKLVFFDVADNEFPRNEKVSRLVAASGAFPGALSAISDEMYLDTPSSNVKKKPVLLADGGITDNSALTLLLSASANAKLRENWKVDVVVSSDASALFGESSEINALGELSRAIDIVYANVGVRRSNAAATNPLLLLSPAAFLNSRLTDEKERRDQIKQMLEAAVSRLDHGAMSILVADMPEGERKKKAEALLALCCQDPDFQKQVKEILVADLSTCVDAFLRASTLRDQFDGDDANNIFRLGQYLVILNWPHLKDKLDKARDLKPAPAIEAALKPVGDQQILAAK